MTGKSGKINIGNRENNQNRLYTLQLNRHLLRMLRFEKADAILNQGFHILALEIVYGSSSVNVYSLNSVFIMFLISKHNCFL